MPDSEEEIPLKDSYYTPDEIAKRWKVGRSTVYSLIQLGRLRARKLGGIRVSKHDLLQYERLSYLKHW